MTRREVISRVSIIVGGSIIGAELFMQGCLSNNSVNKKLGNFFTEEQMALLNEITETIIPKTDTPGAKEAKVADFINIYVRDCYTQDDQEILIKGLTHLNESCKESCQKSFIECSISEKHNCFDQLITEIKQNENTPPPDSDYENRKNKPAKHFFTMLKELTLLGFFTSEIGGTQVLQHLAVPGKFNGCLDYVNGTRDYLDY